MRILFLFIFCSVGLFAQTITNESKEILPVEVSFYDMDRNKLDQNENNPLSSDKVKSFPVIVLILSYDYINHKDTLYSFEDAKQIILEAEDVQDLTGHEVVDAYEEDYSHIDFRDVEGVLFTIGKKVEGIKTDKVKGNSDNYRTMLGGFSGLNIWESDANGLQMDIGGRGLSPSRSSNFNTRQNYYDIAADALGYPESYYTPALDGVERMELIRGASALQFGTQFGGMINFNMKEGNDTTPLEVRSKNTYGSFNTYTTFNSLGGSIKKNLNYYTYYQYKRGDGFRAHSAFESHKAYIKLKYHINEQWSISADYSHLNYLTQQAGGLTDRMFEVNPDSTRRYRNWFKVNWNVFGLSLEHDINKQQKISITGFGLVADRSALGNLERIDRKDHDQERNLIQGNYLNYGSEIKYINKYQLDSTGKFLGVFLTGGRVYRGKTQARQGFADNSNEANFSFLNDRTYTSSDYTYPSQNFAYFFENIFYLNQKWAITPGFRLDYIETNANGNYTNIYYHPSNPNLIIDSLTANENIHRSRMIYLTGIAFTYMPKSNIKFYGNISQNYRAITFNDMRVLNPNFKIDPNLKDETGWTSDIGVKGKLKKYLRFDANFFMLLYRNRIGQTLITDQQNNIYRLRTNIGASRSMGAEVSLSVMYHKIGSGLKKKDWKITQYFNYSYNNAIYVGGAENIYAGNNVELVPIHTLRTGVEMSYKNTGISVNFNYLSDQFSDATNAELTSSGIEGLIPSYHVLDVSLFTSYKWFTFQGGVNNVLNKRYFTRRATGYPGPGIIPSAPINFYLSVDFKINALKRK